MAVSLFLLFLLLLGRFLFGVVLIVVIVVLVVILVVLIVTARSGGLHAVAAEREGGRSSTSFAIVAAIAYERNPSKLTTVF